MALSRTNLLGQITSGNFGTGNFTSTAFTPAGSSLLVVGAAYVENNGTTTDPTSALTISGGSLTWTQQQTAVAAPTAFPSLVKIWTAPVTTGSSMSITLSAGGRAAGLYGVSVVCYTGYNTGTPVGGTATGSQNGGFTGPPDPKSITLSAAPATGDETFGFVFADKSTSGTTQGSAFTEIDDLNNTNWGSLESEIRTGSTSTTVDWVDLRPGGGSLFNFAAVAIVIQAASGAALVFPPGRQTRRRLYTAPRMPRGRARISTPVRAQVNPPFPVNGAKQPREVRGLLPRRPRASAPVPPQVVAAAATFVPQPVKARLRGLRLFRGHASAPPAAPATVPTVFRSKVRGLRPFRSKVAAPLPPQAVTPPAYPPQSVRTRLRGLRIGRGRAASPTPAQIVVTPPAYPPQNVRTRLRGLRLARGRQSTPVPGQITVLPPAYPPAALRARIKSLISRRPRSTTLPPAQSAPLATPHGRPHPLAPRRGHTAMPLPPQTVPAPAYPPRPVRSRTKGLRLSKGRQAAPVPPQVVVVPPPYAPALTRAKKRLARIFRGAARFTAWPAAPVTPSAPTPEIVTRSGSQNVATRSTNQNLSTRGGNQNLTSESTNQNLEA